LTKIKATQWTRMGEKAIADMNENIGIFQTRFTAGDETAIDDINNKVDSLVSAGFIGADKAQKIKETEVKEAYNQLYLSDLEANPKLADERLKSNHYKFTAEEMGKARLHYERMSNKVKNETESSVIAERLNGNALSETGIVDLMNQGKIDPKFAESEIKVIKNGESVKTDPILYMEAIDTVLSQDKTATEKRRYLMGLLADKKISDTDFKSLYKSRVSEFPSVAELYLGEQMDEQEKAQAMARQSPDNSFMQSAVGVIKENTLSSDPMKATLMMRLFDAISNEGLKGEGIVQKAKSILREALISEVPSIGLKKDIPNSVYHNGQVKIVHRGDSDIDIDKDYETESAELSVGDEQEIGGVAYRVVGFDTDGEPLIEEE